MEMIRGFEPWAIEYPYWVVDKWGENGLWYFDSAMDTLEEAQEYCKHRLDSDSEYKIIKVNFEVINVES